MRRATLTIFTALLVCVTAYRAVLLSKGLAAFDATGETRWFNFAYRRDDLEQIFRSVSAASPIVIVIVPPKPRDPGWWHVMALYYLPTVQVEAVQICSACPATTNKIEVVPVVHPQ